MAKVKSVAKEGFVRVKAEGGAISWNGESFDVVDGVAEVPAESVADFACHGVVPIVEE